MCTAGLVPEIMSTYYEETGYSDPENQDHADALWDSIDFDAGIVALSDDYAKEKNLPIAQRFPWDLTKGIYLLNGHHHLHCLVRYCLSCCPLDYLANIRPTVEKYPQHHLRVSQRCASKSPRSTRVTLS